MSNHADSDHLSHSLSLPQRSGNGARSLRGGHSSSWHPGSRKTRVKTNDPEKGANPISHDTASTIYDRCLPKTNGGVAAELRIRRALWSGPKISGIRSNERWIMLVDVALAPILRKCFVFLPVFSVLEQRTVASLTNGWDVSHPDGSCRWLAWSPRVGRREMRLR